MLVRLFILLLLSVSPTFADDILVITGLQVDIKDITMKKVENIFLKKTLVNAQGTRWIPLNLNPDHPIRQAFSQTVFKQRPEDMETYWNDQYFQGISPPYVVNSEEAMLRFIASTSGAIGYILPCHLDSRVQVVFKIKVQSPVEKNCPPRTLQ
jgi:hypothetical protein